MEEKELKEVLSQVEKAAGTKASAVVAEALKGYLTAEETKAALKEVDAENVSYNGKTIVKMMEEIAETAKKAEDAATNAANGGEFPTLRQQIKAWQETNKDGIAAVKAKRQAEITPLTIKAPVTMTVGGSLGSSPVLPRAGVAGEIIDFVRIQPTFWDMLPKGRTRLNPYYWREKFNKQGNATFVAENTVKPQASFELRTPSSTPKKVAEWMEVSTELLSDLDGIESLIRDEMSYEVRMAANDGALFGDGVDENPEGVTENASTYITTGISTPNPNNFDAIRAAVAQIRNLNHFGMITAWISPIDAANMDLSKASDSGVYMLPPFTTPDGRRIAGVQIYEDNNIPEGYLLIGDISKFKILMYEDFNVIVGLKNDDLIKNKVTFVGEMRFHQFLPEYFYTAFIYDTFANIKAAITPEIV